MELCPPALIYLAFSITQILIDTFYGFYNTAFVKLIVMIIITMLLNVLCNKGMGVVSWIIVFVPFVLMTTIVAVLLYAFGLDPSTGKLNVPSCNNNTNKGGNLIYKRTITQPNDHVDISYSETPLDETFE